MKKQRGKTGCLSRFGSFFVVLLILGAAFNGAKSSSKTNDEPITIESPEPSNRPESLLFVHFLDVGQGDAVVITCNDEAMMIDGGPPEKSDLVFSYLRNTLGVKKLKYIIASHPDKDHVGGINAALRASTDGVGAIFCPAIDDNGEEMQNILEFANENNIPVVNPERESSLYIGDAVVTFVSVGTENETVNDSSLVARIDHGNNSFLFTGDIEGAKEEKLIDSPSINVDVLKIAHHGSPTSSIPEFLIAASPLYSVISVGDQNTYGHPDENVLYWLKLIGSEILRTDWNGHIVCKSDGETLSFSIEKQAPSTTPKAITAPTEKKEQSYIGNKNTHVFHYLYCSSVEKMKEKNKITLKARDEAIQKGYKPCNNCKP